MGMAQDVFRHEHLQLEAVNKPVQLILEPLFDGLNLIGELAGTGGDIEQAALHRRHLGMVEMRQRHRMRSGGGRIQQPGHPEAGMVEPLQNMRPFARLQSDAVGAVKTVVMKPMRLGVPVVRIQVGMENAKSGLN